MTGTLIRGTDWGLSDQTASYFVIWAVGELEFAKIIGFLGQLVCGGFTFQS